MLDPQVLSGSVAVLVPAGGAGTRMGSTRKQFRELGGAPLLVHTLRVFDAHPGVTSLFVSAPADRCDELSRELGAYGIEKLAAVVVGGATRQRSVAAALAAVPRTVEIVLVHDAVRPFVSAHEIQAVIDAVARTGAAALALPVADTLRRAEGEVFGETVPREGFYRMQTPQGFKAGLLREAFRTAEQEGVDATDDVALVQRIGHPVHVVPGSARNFKITTPEDWALAEDLFHQMSGS